MLEKGSREACTQGSDTPHPPKGGSSLERAVVQLRLQPRAAVGKVRSIVSYGEVKSKPSRPTSTLAESRNLRKGTAGEAHRLLPGAASEG